MIFLLHNEEFQELPLLILPADGSGEPVEGTIEDITGDFWEYHFDALRYFEQKNERAMQTRIHIDRSDDSYNSYLLPQVPALEPENVFRIDPDFVPGEGANFLYHLPYPEELYRISATNGPFSVTDVDFESYMSALNPFALTGLPGWPAWGLLPGSGSPAGPPAAMLNGDIGFTGAKPLREQRITLEIRYPPPGYIPQPTEPPGTAGYVHVKFSTLIFPLRSYTGAAGFTGLPGDTGGWEGEVSVEDWWIPLNQPALQSTSAKTVIRDEEIPRHNVQIFIPNWLSAIEGRVIKEDEPDPPEILYGAGAPSVGLGRAGDYYVDRPAVHDPPIVAPDAFIYGPKTSTWGTGEVADLVALSHQPEIQKYKSRLAQARLAIQRAEIILPGWTLIRGDTNIRAIIALGDDTPPGSGLRDFRYDAPGGQGSRPIIYGLAYLLAGALDGAERWHGFALAGAGGDVIIDGVAWNVNGGSLVETNEDSEPSFTYPSYVDKNGVAQVIRRTVNASPPVFTTRIELRRTVARLHGIGEPYGPISETP